MELKWYVLRAVSGQERKAKEMIDHVVQKRNIIELIPQVLVPIEKVKEIRNGKAKDRERNSMPGYILINADPAILKNGEVFHELTGIPGVIGFLGAERGRVQDVDKIVPLRVSEVNRILGRADEAVTGVAQFTVSFITGETINVTDGPFAGMQGVVEEVFEDRKKLNVTVKIFGRNTPIELSFAQVQKLV